MKIEVMKVTPAIAQEWLNSNTDHNRKISSTTVNRYAQDMIRGKWLITGEAIKFDQGGRLIDGQHRLAAVVASKQTVDMCVIRDLAADTMLVIDTGRSRSAGDALSISELGGGYANELAALARKVIGHQNNAPAVIGGKKITIKGATITNREIIEFCAKNDLLEHIRFSTRITKQAISSALNKGEYAFFHWLFSQKSKSDATNFLTNIATLEDVSADSPIRVLIQKLTRSSIQLDGKMRQTAIIMAWNAWRTGAKMSTIHVARMDSFPMPQAV